MWVPARPWVPNRLGNAFARSRSRLDNCCEINMPVLERPSGSVFGQESPERLSTPQATAGRRESGTAGGFSARVPARTEFRHRWSIPPCASPARQTGVPARKEPAGHGRTGPPPAGTPVRSAAQSRGRVPWPARTKTRRARDSSRAHKTCRSYAALARSSSRDSVSNSWRSAAS
jgi:hypothetical protein